MRMANLKWKLILLSDLEWKVSLFVVHYPHTGCVPTRQDRVSKLRPAGHIRLATPFHPAREDILSIMKK